MFKDNISMEQAAENVLRSYLVRCFSKVKKQYPPISAMNPVDGVEELLRLKREGKLTIQLATVGNIIECKIQYVN